MAKCSKSVCPNDEGVVMSSEPTPAGEANPPDGFSVFPYSDGFAAHVGPLFIEMRDGEGVLGFRVMPHHCNPAGICHGGMMMTLMDMAIGVNVAIGAKTDAFTPSVNLVYDFVAPGPQGAWLESKVDWVHATKRTGFANGYLMGPDGVVMRANGICKIARADDPRFQMKGGKKFSFERAPD